MADLAELYYLIALRGKEFRGHIFNAAPNLHALKDVVQALAKETGFKGEIKFVPPQDPFSEVVASNLAVSSNKVCTLRLGIHKQRQKLFLVGIP